MNQSEIDAFLAIVDYGSLSAASKKLYIGQPTISTRIRLLEEDLGVKLFSRNRGKRFAELTPEGKTFEIYARKWRAIDTDMRIAISTDKTNHLNIAAGRTICSYIMPDTYTRLLAKPINVSLHLWSQNFFESFMLVQSGEVDAAIVTDMRHNSHLRTYQFANEENVLLYGNNVSHPEHVSVKELNLQDSIYIKWNDSFHQWYTYWFAEQGNPRLRTTDCTFAETLLNNSERWCIAPITMAKMVEKKGIGSYSHIIENPPPRFLTLICKNEISTYPGLEQIVLSIKETVTSMGATWLLSSY